MLGVASVVCYIAWDSLLYWRKIDQRVNVVQSHTVVIVHLSYLLDLFLFTSCIYAWFGFVLCIILFSLVSIPPTWVDNLSYLEAVNSINFLARYFYICATSFVFSILSIYTHRSGFWTVDGWSLRQLLLFFVISTPPWPEKILLIGPMISSAFHVRIVILLSVKI